MQTSLTFSSIVALSGVMFIGALIPSMSVMTVSARSVAYGFGHGVLTTIGIVLGDIFFILLAIFGLAILAETLGSLFVLIKYLGGAYLIWLGTTLWRTKTKAIETERALESSLLSSFLAGLLITLADQKAILFYLGLFPTFLDLSALSYFDTSIIIVIAIVAVGGPKLVYALLADRAGTLFSHSNAIQRINRVAGGIIVIVGIIVLLKA